MSGVGRERERSGCMVSGVLKKVFLYSGFLIEGLNWCQKCIWGKKRYPYFKGVL